MLPEYLPRNLTTIIQSPGLLLPRHMDVQELPILLLSRLKNDSLQLCDADPNLKVRIFSTQIGLQPLTPPASASSKNSTKGTKGTTNPRIDKEKSELSFGMVHRILRVQHIQGRLRDLVCRQRYVFVILSERDRAHV